MTHGWGSEKRWGGMKRGKVAFLGKQRGQKLFQVFSWHLVIGQKGQFLGWTDLFDQATFLQTGIEQDWGESDLHGLQGWEAYIERYIFLGLSFVGVPRGGTTAIPKASLALFQAGGNISRLTTWRAAGRSEILEVFTNKRRPSVIATRAAQVLIPAGIQSVPSARR